MPWQKINPYVFKEEYCYLHTHDVPIFKIEYKAAYFSDCWRKEEIKFHYGRSRSAYRDKEDTISRSYHADKVASYFEFNFNKRDVELNGIAPDLARFFCETSGYYSRDTQSYSPFLHLEEDCGTPKVYRDAYSYQALKKYILAICNLLTPFDQQIAEYLGINLVDIQMLSTKIQQDKELAFLELWKQETNDPRANWFLGQYYLSLAKQNKLQDGYEKARECFLNIKPESAIDKKIGFDGGKTAQIKIAKDNNTQLAYKLLCTQQQLLFKQSDLNNESNDLFESDENKESNVKHRKV